MTKKTRDQLREAIFRSENLKPKSKIVKFFGEDIEVRQPSVDTVLDFRNSDEIDKKQRMVGMLIAYCFVPETDERLFEDGDAADLLQMPFGGDFTALQKAMSELTDVKLVEDEAVKNSGETVSQ